MSLLSHSLDFWVVAVPAVLLIGVAKAGFGGGAGVIATPLMALVLPVPEAAALLLPILIMADIFAVSHYRRDLDRHELSLLLPAAVLGIVLAGLLFTQLVGKERVLEVGVGLIALAFVSYRIAQTAIFRALSRRPPAAAWGVLLGSVAGFASTLAHAGGPPFTIYLLPQGLSRERFVGTSAWFFFAVNVLKLFPYGFLGLLGVKDLPTALLLAPLAFVGVRLGVRLNRLVSEKVFNLAIYLLLTLTGAQLILGRNLLDLLL